jgi:hypothetical protein
MLRVSKSSRERFAMRIDKPWRTLALAAFVVFTLVAFVEPAAFNGLRERAGDGGVWLALSLLADGCGASLTLAAPALGTDAHVSVPLFLALAAPYALRLIALDAVLKWLRRPARPAAACAKPRAYPENAPAALPQRVAVALLAASRARH